MSYQKDAAGQQYTSPDNKPAASGVLVNGGTHVMQSGFAVPVKP